MATTTLTGLDVTENPSQGDHTTINLGIAIGSSYERHNEEFGSTISEGEKDKLQELVKKSGESRNQWEGDEDERGDYLQELSYKYGFLAGMRYQRELQEAGRA